MGTLADLVSGFQSGYTGVQDARRRRKLNRAIDYELGSREEARIGRQRGRERLGYGEGYEGADFTMPQTLGEKFVGKLRGWFGAGSGQQSTQAIAPEMGAPQMQPAGLQESGARTYGTEENRYRGRDQDAMGPPAYRDGGAVRNMKRYANGGRSIQPDRSTMDGRNPGGYHVENPITGFTDGGMALPTAPGQLQPQNMGQAIPTPSRQMMSAQPGQAIPGFQDGGAVDEERMKRTYGENYVTEAEAEEFRAARSRGEHRNRNPYDERYSAGRRAIPTSGGGAGEFVRDLGRSAAGYFDKTTQAALEGREYMDIADAQLAEAEGAREVGRATRETGSAALTAAAGTTKGLLEDVFVDNPITQSALGFFGYTGEDGAGVNQDKKDAVTEAVAPDSASQPGADAPNQQTPQAQNAREPAGPPDEIIDFSTEAREVMPEDMPSHGVKDWEDERRFWAAQAISLGNDPFAAMEAVTNRQRSAFKSYGDQAFQLLSAGDATGAARALYAAYQYFPNGADVRFGVQKGVDGQPVLVGMGNRDGEPVGDPVVMTPETIAAQMQNMSNPAAWNTWVTDQGKIAQEIREYTEVTKPAAESRARYQDRAGRAALLGAEARLASSSGAGGLDQSDLDRANSAFMKAVEMESFENEQQADFMMSLMAEIYQRYGGRVQYPSVIDDVRTAIRSGDFTDLDAKYGQQ